MINLFQAMQMIRGGGNPMQIMAQMAGGNPQAMQFLENARGKTPAQLQTMAQNLARERGVSLESVFNQLGLTMPGGIVK